MADAENVVRDLIIKILNENKIKTKNVELKPICTEGANFTTSLYILKVNTGDENLNLFAKVAILSGEMRKQVNVSWIYKTERFFYLTLLKIFENIQDKYNLPEEHRFLFPKCYGINHEEGQETVVLENLTEKGYESYDRFKSLDWEHAAISVEQLAKFHALSFAYDKENPKEFKELISTMEYKMGPTDENNEEMLSMWTNMVDRALNVIDEEHRDKIRALMMHENFTKHYNKPNARPVLCHGDYRLSNILFRHKGETLQAIPVDYQTLYSGCPPGDLLYFIFMGSDEKFRQKHYDRLVNHYYDHLCQAMTRLNVDPIEVYPRETFDEHMKEILPYALFLGVAILPVVTVETALAPKMDEVSDVSKFVVEPSALFASRFQGIVNDCVRWGVI